MAPSQNAVPNPANDSSRPPRNGVYQQALSQAIPSVSNSAQKRAASARSPSPSHPTKLRKTDLPTGPRAHRDGPVFGGRSLIDRVGGPAGRNNAKNHHKDEIQARIDSIVNNATEQNMMIPPGFPAMMDMNMAAANMANPLLIQEMMMNQMVLMAQMATSMGIINPATGQFSGQDFPMQQGANPNDMTLFPPPNNVFPHQQGGTLAQNNHTNAGRGRGGVRGGRGTGRGRGGSTITSGSSIGSPASPAELQEAAPPTPAAFPAPIAPTAVIAAPAAMTTPPAYAILERPQSPTLCKFGLKCTNAQCRYSHPSPVATAESGVVLSNDPCENGKNCKDKDCVKAHVSPAVLNPNRKHIFYFGLTRLISLQLNNQYRKLRFPLHLFRTTRYLVDLATLAQGQVARFITPLVRRKTLFHVDLGPDVPVYSVLSNIQKVVSFLLLSIAVCRRPVLL